MFDAFFSHNSADKSEIRSIWKNLQAKGLNCWYDEENLRAGEGWLPLLETELPNSKCCVLFYGPSGFGPWHEMERQLALLMAADAWREGRHFGIIPVRLADAPEWCHLTLPPFLRLYASVSFAKPDDEAALDRLYEAISGEAAPPEILEAGSTESPYKGMKPYLESDSSKYFGRNNYILQISTFLLSAPERRFLAIVGASGSGKSSLMHAGVLARLRAGSFQRESKDWVYVKLRAGQNAWGDLRALLAGTPPFDKFNNFTASSPEKWLHESATAALGTRPEHSRLILLIDQFEELFTLRPQGDTPRDKKLLEDYVKTTWEPLLKNINFAVNQPSGLVSVTITIRSDFLDAFKDSPIAQMMDETHLRCLIPPLLETEIRAVVERPAWAAKLKIDNALTERVVQDYMLDPNGALPFLQEALHRVWKVRKDGRLSYLDYQQFGGLKGAINAHAQEVMEQWPRDESRNGAMFRQVFVHLVRLADDGGLDTKRRRPIQELPGGEAARRFAQKLTDEKYRLLVSDRDDSSSQNEDLGRVEIAHESLIRGWKQLDEWLNDTKLRPIRLRLRHLEANARSWQIRHTEGAGASLLMGKELFDAEMVSRRLADEVPQVLADYIRESRTTANRRMLKQGVATLAVISVLAVLAYLAWSKPAVPESFESFQAANRAKLKVLASASAVLVTTGDILAQRKDDPNVWYHRARAYLDLKEAKNAENTLSEWTQHMPLPGPLAHLMRAEVAMQESDPKTAIDCYEKYLADPEVTKEERIAIWPQLAGADESLSKWEDAVTVYQKWIAEADNPSARARLAQALAKSGNWTEYTNAVTALKNNFPDSPEVTRGDLLPAALDLSRLASIVEADKYNEEAWMDYISKLIETRYDAIALTKAMFVRDRAPDSAPLRIVTAYLLCRIKQSIPPDLDVLPSPAWLLEAAPKIFTQHLEALRRADAAVKKEPAAATRYYTRGQSLARLGQYRMAIQDFENALKLDPNLKQASTLLEESKSFLDEKVK